MKEDSTIDSQQRQPRNPPRGRSRRYITPLILLVVLATASFLIWKLFFATRALENIITLSGRIEGDDSAIAPKIAGRILEVRYREGDEVQAGDPIAILDAAQVRAREDQARAALSSAEARARAAREQIAVLQQQLRQNELQTEQSKTDAEGRVRQAEAELTAAEADLAQQEASYTMAKFDKEAYTRLAETGAVSERQGKQASATAAQQAAAVAAANRRVEAARGAVLTAKANLKNPSIRRAGVAAVEQQITQQRAEVSAAEADAEQARAQLREAQADRDDLIVRAPFNGTVTTRAAEPGEVVTAGTALVTLVDLSKVYLRGFVPEGESASSR